MARPYLSPSWRRQHIRRRLRAVHVVLIATPGPGSGRHWSEPFVDDLAALLRQNGTDVLQLRGNRPAAALHEVLRSCDDPVLEVELAHTLRRRPAHAVVHAGFGAGGSPNLLWLADRMGSAAIAVASPVEVVCRRGDWVDEQGRTCAIVDDVSRCATCCARAPGRPAPTSDFENRLDLLVASLQVAAAVFHDAAVDPAPLAALGVPARALRAAAPADLAGAVARELAVTAAS